LIEIMKLTLGFSPCPNDTFVFDAMVHGRIDTEGIEFDYFLADVEELNRRAFTGEPDITKMSLFAYAFAADKYLILDSGSALGYKNGPLLISKYRLEKSKLADKRIAIPGKYTTANLLFSIAYPDVVNKKEYLFSDIERAIIEEEVDAGLIIHETRFTFQAKGLKKVSDMGEYWEDITRLPIPLGTIVINRRLPTDITLRVNRIIRRSLDFAYADSMASFDFVKENAQEMDTSVMNRHIKMFVNKFTLNLGKEGKLAIAELLETANKKGITPKLPDKIFVT